MVMDTLQIRLNPGLIEKIDSIVKTDFYSSRSDVIRDAIRHFIWSKEIGSIVNKGNSVKQVRSARKKLSKEKIHVSI